MALATQPSENVIALSGFEPAEAGLAMANRAALARRFSTLVPLGPAVTGGLGVVQRARTTDAAAEVALKTPRHRPGCTTEEIRRDDATLAEEYKTLCQVRNLRFFPTAFGRARTAEGEPAILMEWVKGVSIDEYRDARWRNGCPGATVAALGEALLTALDSTRALSATFIHRDLAPKNVIIRTEETPLALQEERGAFDVCLIDLGSAELVSHDLTFTQRAGLARGGQPPYAAPEMLSDGMAAMGSRANQKVDVYAVASILYELYCGSYPFGPALDRERAMRGAEADFGRVKLGACTPLAPKAPADQSLCVLIGLCLAPRQADRPSVAQFLAAIRRWRQSGEAGMRGTAAQIATTKPQVNPYARQQIKPSTPPQAEARIPMEQIRRARRARMRKRMLSIAVIAVAVVEALVVIALLAAE